VTDWLHWPFLEDRHRDLYQRVCDWCGDNADDSHPDDVDAACRALVASLGRAGLLKLCVADGDSIPDVRSLAITRALLASRSGLADFAFAMQGLGSGAISLFGSTAQKAEWLPKVASGEAIAAYALHAGKIIFTHTEVPSAYGGRGIGSALVRFALASARTRGLKVVPVCPFVAAYIEKHPEEQDLLDPT